MGRMMEQIVGQTEVSDAVLRAAVDLARQAPSLHNAQPWSWRVGGAAAELFADPKRAVPVADPTGRELLLGCGAALHHLRVVLAARGWQATVTRLPDPAQPDLLARVEVTGQQDPDPAAERMVAAIPLRRTDRRPFAPQPLSTDALDALREATESEDAYLALATDQDDRIELAVLSARADRIQSADPAYAEEMAAWTGYRPHRDGVPASQIPHVTQRRHSDVTLRDFEVAAPGEAEVPAGVDEQPVWAVIYTRADTGAAHLRAGEALSALWLTATALGVAAGVQSQPVEVPAVRAQLEGRLLDGLGHAQLVLRLGRPDPAAPELPATPRRPMDEVLLPSPA